MKGWNSSKHPILTANQMPAPIHWNPMNEDWKMRLTKSQIYNTSSGFDAVSEKNAWLDAYLPEIDSEHRIFVACGSSKARAAANRLKTPCIDNSFVLLDDYSVNLHEWKANRGSCIKLRNGINGNGGTWKGESVTRFDTAENIADRIWSIIKKQMQ